MAIRSNTAFQAQIGRARLRLETVVTPSQTSSSPSRATLLHETVGTVNVATPCSQFKQDRPKLDRSIDASTLLRVRSGARIDPRLRARFRRWTDPCAAMAEIFELGGQYCRRLETHRSAAAAVTVPGSAGLEASRRSPILRTAYGAARNGIRDTHGTTKLNEARSLHRSRLDYIALMPAT